MVHEILIIWNSPLAPPHLVDDENGSVGVGVDVGPFASLLHDGHESSINPIKVRILVQENNSPNNRYMAAYQQQQQSRSQQRSLDTDTVPTTVMLEDSMVVHCNGWIQILRAATESAANGSLVRLVDNHHGHGMAVETEKHKAEMAMASSEHAVDGNGMVCSRKKRGSDTDNYTYHRPHTLQEQQIDASGSNNRRTELSRVRSPSPLLIVPQSALRAYGKLPLHVLEYLDEHADGRCDDIVMEWVWAEATSAVLLPVHQKSNRGIIELFLGNAFYLQCDGYTSTTKTNSSTYYSTMDTDNDNSMMQMRTDCMDWVRDNLTSDSDPNLDSDSNTVGTEMTCSFSTLEEGVDAHNKLTCVTVLDTTCPVATGSVLRPQLFESDAPGDHKAKAVPGDILPLTKGKGVWNYDRKDDFFTKGVAGPFRTTLSVQELEDAFQAMQQHRKSVSRAVRQTRAKQDAATVENEMKMYGKANFMMERCYAYDERCRRLAEDKGIIDQVRRVIGDDVIVWSMSDFSKGMDSIQPWHTDIEPYDRCYGKNVQIWLAVDGVSKNATLQVMTGSHRLMSATWMYPDHVTHATTVSDKNTFETDTLLPCAQSMDGTSEIVSPVTRDGEFMVLHSHMWHAAESTTLPQTKRFRRAIRVTFAHPDCQVGAVYEYNRPDIPPLVPIAAMPPVLLVSGEVRGSFPEGMKFVNNFLHFATLPVRHWAPIQLLKRKARFGRKPAPTGVQIWTKNLPSLGGQAKINPSKVTLFEGHTELFSTLEIAFVHLNANSASHQAETHVDAGVKVVIDGLLGIFTLKKNEKTLNNILPEVTLLPKGGLHFEESNGTHADICGSVDGCWFLNVKFEPHVLLNSVDKAAHSPMGSALRSLMPPPPDTDFVTMHNAMHLRKVFGKVCRCIHNMHADDDHETILLVEDVPANVTLFSLPDRKPLPKGTLLFYPLFSEHGIEARDDVTGKVILYRKKGLQFEAIPRCVVVEFWTPESN
jgi:ectoine hydroxylase-related dioxygenase (phytanoyl-CoA dioxygenase family)